jgi:hypothetical protein
MAFGATRPIPLRLLVFVVVTLLLLAVLEEIRVSQPVTRSQFDRPRPPREVRRPEQLERVERRVKLAISSAFDLHYRLRPLLREAAAHRLLTRYGLDLDHDEDRVRELLGEDNWMLLRVDAAPPEDAWGPGIPVERLGSLVERVESL